MTETIAVLQIQYFFLYFVSFFTFLAYTFGNGYLSWKIIFNSNINSSTIINFGLLFKWILRKQWKPRDISWEFLNRCFKFAHFVIYDTRVWQTFVCKKKTFKILQLFLMKFVTFTTRLRSDTACIPKCNLHVTDSKSSSYVFYITWNVKM